jgi:hypothetical protein
MDERTARGFGAAAVLGGVLSILTAVPSRWFGAPQTDAYLFDPAAFSPLWIERSLVPLGSVLAGVLVVVGIAGLVARDGQVASRLRRFSGYTAVAGLAMVLPALVAFALTRTGTDPLGAILVILGALSGLLGAVLAVPALVAAGYGYVRAGRPVVGYGLAAGPLVAVVLSVGASALVDSLGFGLLPAIALFAIAPLAVGHELWTHPAPVRGGSTDGPERADAAAPEDEREASGGDDLGTDGAATDDDGSAGTDGAATDDDA